jgi:hypothetical protein
VQSKDLSWSVDLAGDERYRDGDRVITCQQGVRRR